MSEKIYTINIGKRKKLIKGTKEILVLLEEADRLWENLQGKDREEQIKKLPIFT